MHTHHRSAQPSLTRAAAMLAFAALLTFAAGCPSSKSSPKQSTTPTKESASAPAPAAGSAAPKPAPPPEKTYTIRGRISGMPNPPHEPYPNFHHEPIPGFVGRDGSVSEMSEMQMQLPLADGVTLGDLKLGDKVEFDLWVDWGTKQVFEVRRLVKLPDDTRLNLQHKSQGNPEGGG